MSSITININGSDKPVQLYVNWMDENCVTHEIELEVSISDKDTMELRHKPPDAGDVILLCRERGDRHV